MSTAIWVIRQDIAVRQVRGLLEGLESVGARDYDAVRIMVIDDEHGFSLPNGVVFTTDNLPAQGFLFLPDDYGEGPPDEAEG